MGSHLLLVDGDPRTLRTLDVSLRGAGFQVDTAITGTEALAQIESVPPDLIIADADLEGIDGFELCARLRHTPAGERISFILLVANQTLDRKVRTLEVGADDYLVKPVFVQDVLARVRASLRRRDRDRFAFAPADAATGPAGAAGTLPLSGDLSEISVVDLLQLIESNPRSGIAHLRSDTGRTGTLYFRNGAIIDADVGPLSGQDALGRLLAWRGGTFAMEWKNIRRKDVIERTTSDLILDGMHGIDERNRLSAQFGDLRAVFEVDYRLLAERLAEIPDEANGILKLCDGVRNLEEVIEGAVMPDVAALTVLLRLRDAGIIFTIANRHFAGGLAVAKPSQDWSAQGSSPVPSAIPTRVGSGDGHTHSASLRHSFADRDRQEEQDQEAVALAFHPPEDAGMSRRRTAPGLGEGIPALLPENQALQDTDLRQLADDIPQEGPAAAGSGLFLAETAPPTNITQQPATTPDFDHDLPSNLPEPTPSEGHASSGSVRSATRFPPDTISRSDALDELGLPSRWRALRLLALTALIMGATGALLAHRFRTNRVRPNPAAPAETLRPAPAPRDQLSPSSTHEERSGSAVAAAELEESRVAARPTALAVPEPGLPAPADNPRTAAGGSNVGALEPAASGRAPVGTLPAPQLPPVTLPAPRPLAVAPGSDRVATGTGAVRRAPGQLDVCRSAFTHDRLREALTACTAAVAANPGSAEALTLLAHTELNRGHLDRAGDLAEKAVAADPNVADAYVIIGGVRQDSGQNAAAKAAYLRYLRLAPRGRYADDLRAIVNGL